MFNLHLLCDQSTGFDLEDNNQTHDEIERVYYGLISDKGWKQLKEHGDYEDQEQWTFKTDSGNCRVRSVDNKRWICTVKKDGKETDSSVSKDFFDHFKSIVSNGMVKRRYNFPIDVSKFNTEDKKKWQGLKWEVDVFYLPNGEFAPWCKIDLEVHTTEQLRDGTRPEFPIDFKEVIVDEGQAKPLVRRLYEDYFIRTNNDVSLEADTAFITTIIESGSPTQAITGTLKSAFAEFEAIRGSDDYGTESYNIAKDKVCRALMTDGSVLDTFVCLYKEGPVDSGDIPSKSGRDILVEAGLCISTINEGEWSWSLVGICESIWNYGVEKGYFTDSK